MHGRDTVHNDSSEDEQEEISNNGGICSGIAVKWLEQILVYESAPDDAWPNISRSLELQLYFEEADIALDDFLSWAGMNNSGRADFDSFRAAMQHMWQNNGQYLIILTNYEENGGHAYAFCKYEEREYAHLFDPNEGVYVVYSEEGLLECFWETWCAYTWGEDDHQILTIRASVGNCGDQDDDDDGYWGNEEEEEKEEEEEEEDGFGENDVYEDENDYDGDDETQDGDHLDENEEYDFDDDSTTASYNVKAPRRAK